MIGLTNISTVNRRLVISRRPLNNLPQFTTETLNVSPGTQNLAWVTAEQLGQQLRLEAAWREGKSGVKFLILVKMKLRLKGYQWPANNH